jgi:hypothetical protein
MAEDAVRMEDIDNAYFNFNYLNYFKNLCVRKSGHMKKFHEKVIIMNVMLVEISSVCEAVDIRQKLSRAKQ